MEMGDGSFGGGSDARADPSDRTIDAPDRAAYTPPRWLSWALHVRTFDSLHIRDYRLLWLGQTGTSMGHWMDHVARGWLIYQLTGSALQLGGVAAMRAVPLIVFGVIAGVVADRYGRKTQLIVAQVTNAIINAVLATLVVTGLVEPWHIYVTALLAGTVQAFQQPARQALITDLVGKRYLQNAIALNSAVVNLSRSVGPAIAGAMIALIGVGGSYYAQALLYAWATLWTIQMNVPGEVGLLGLLGRSREKAVSPTDTDPLSRSPAVGHHATGSERLAPATPKHGSFFGSMKEGFEYVSKTEIILSLMLLSLAPVFLGMPYTSLMPVFALDVLDVGAVGQGLLMTSAGVGALVGALFIASLGNFKRKGYLLIGGATMFGVTLVGFSYSTWMPLSMAMLFAVGMSSTSYNSQSQTILQTLSPAHLRGRVIGIYLLNRGLMPLGTLLAGALAEAMGGPTAVLIMGISCTLVAIGVALKQPDLLRLSV